MPYQLFNEYERKVALVLDRDKRLLWWFRNRVGKDAFAIQGHRRERLFPDFVVQSDPKRTAPTHTVLVLEAKGKHLAGNQDTTYKRKVAGYFDRAGKQVGWQELGDGFKDHQFRFQVLDEALDLGRDWRDELAELL